MTDNPDNHQVIAQYHERTKHRLDGYAKGPGTLDWDAQPDPFRRFDGAELISLPLRANQLSVPFAALSSAEPQPIQLLTMDSVAVLLENALALSAWKQYGTARWSLRVNPSSGNLHPTEAYLIVMGFKALVDGVYHYRADEHALELRCAFDSARTEPVLYMAFSSVHWREAWKYGERAYRYCQHDVGHAIAAVSYSAAALGWQVQPQLQIGDDSLSIMLGLDRVEDFADAEREHADLLFAVYPKTQPGGSVQTDNLLCMVERGTWFGRANVLDLHHLYEWPLIDEVSQACKRPDSDVSPLLARQQTGVPDYSKVEPLFSTEAASSVFHRRRSAQAFDGKTVMPKAAFLRCMDQLLARRFLPPWSALCWPSRLHLVLFVHRVEGLAPGLYAMPRSTTGADLMRDAMRPEFQWAPVETLPTTLPIYQLFLAKAERTIAKLSCQQPIAGDSCFSVAMLAEFGTTVMNAPYRYRELFWEAGAIGQTLYLEAEAAGLRGTGIGCYFDDAVHELLGLTGTALQSLYHFTVGEPLVDHRIATLPPYTSDQQS